MRPIAAFLAGLGVLTLALTAGGRAGFATDPTPTLGNPFTPQPSAGPCPAPTPTPSPSPTPAPAPTPTPEFVYLVTYLYACNDTGVAASGLRASANNAASLNPLVENAPGCPAPRLEFNPPVPAPLYHSVTLRWDTACVDPGETVVLAFGSDCPGCEVTLTGHSWLFDTPASSPTIAPWFTPIPTPGPDDCLPTPAPTPGAAFLGICSAAVAPGGTVTVALTGLFLGSAIGAWTVDVEFDDTVLTLTGCASTPAGLCTTDYTPSTARFVGASASGLTGDIVFGTLTFEAGSDEGIAGLDVLIAQLTTTVGQDISLSATDGTIAVTSATPTPSPTPTPTPTAAPAAAPTATPAALPKSGGSRGETGAPYAALAAITAAGALALAAGWAAVRRRKA